MPAFVYKNNSTNSYLKIDLKGEGKNKNGIGAKAIVENNGLKQTAQNFTSRGFQSSVENGFLFGFGKDSIIDKLTVIWPNQQQKVLTNVALNQNLVIDQNETVQFTKSENPVKDPLFSDQTYMIKGNLKHTENIYNDFDHEILLHRMLSTNGPVVLKGDMNNDGLIDLSLIHI